MLQIKLTQQQAECLENTVEAHMYFLSCELNGLDEEIPEDWSSFAPYCGCQTCETREYLMCVTKFLREQGIVDIYIEGDSGHEDALFD